jgi:sarcosine oxidase
VAKPFDVAIIGLGAMGSAGAAECAARGARVVGFEQFGFAHDRSSSHGESRIFRLAYFEHPDYVPLLRRARELWLSIDLEAEVALFHACGGLWIGEADHPLVAGALQSARLHRLAHELLDGATVAERFAPLRLPPDLVGFYEPDAGAVRPERAVRHFLARAAAAGATLHERSRVQRWFRDGAGFTIECAGQRVHAARLILAAGPWSAKLARDLGVPLLVTRQPTAWFGIKGDAARFLPARFPCWGLARDRHSFFYGCPVLGEPPALKVAIHMPLSPTDPDEVEREVQPHEVDELREGIARILPELRDAPLVRTSVCLYTNTPDGHFVIDVLEEDPRRVIACGFSGHGFKFAPVIGEILADLALEGETRHRIEFLSRQRFQSPGPD